VKRPTLLLLATLVALGIAAPASAIQFGHPDGNAHPQVGLVLFYDAHGNPLSRCSGVLVSPTVFLTAGHCTFGTASAQVWLNSGPITVASGYPFTGGASFGRPYTHPLFDNFAASPANYDLGVVVLDTPQPGPYATLAPAGTLDALKKNDVGFDVVGYGLQDALPPSIMADRTRYAGQTKLTNLNNTKTAGYNLQMSAAPGTGGSVCYGDSGGPEFLAGTLQIVGVNSFVQSKFCMGAAFGYRTDTADSLAFINSFLR
jgi:V8-like Glu-specific endopeptidase